MVKTIKKYQCEICSGIYKEEDRAINCEGVGQPKILTKGQVVFLENSSPTGKNRYLDISVLEGPQEILQETHDVVYHTKRVRVFTPTNILKAILLESFTYVGGLGGIIITDKEGTVIPSDRENIVERADIQRKLEKLCQDSLFIGACGESGISVSEILKS
ncbi:MAG: hypothetical protein ABIH72_00200 [archaeon]